MKKMKNAKIKDTKICLPKYSGETLVARMIVYSDENNGKEHEVSFNMNDKKDRKNLTDLMNYAHVTYIEDLNGFCLGDLRTENKITFKTTKNGAKAQFYSFEGKNLIQL